MKIDTTSERFVFSFPLSLFLALGIYIYLPIAEDNFYILLSLKTFVQIIGMMGIVCLPSALVFLVLLRVIRPFRESPLVLIVAIPLMMNLGLWVAFVHLLKSID